MIILMDTSTATCELTIVDGNDNHHTYSWVAGRQMADGILAFIQRSLDAHNSNMKEISAIGFMKGPGSFTGLRIGASVCNALSGTLSIPVVGEAGDEWQQVCLKRLASDETDEILLPFYGKEATITTPRK